MPLFDFRCSKCGNEFESIENQEVNESTCPKCTYISKRILA